MRLRQRFSRSEAGMTLVEILVASAIASALLLGVSEMIVTSRKADVQAEARMDLTDLKYEVSSILYNPSRCTQALGGTPSISGHSVALSSQLNPSGSTVNYGKLQISSILLTNVSPISGTGNEYKGDIEVSGTEINGQTFKFDEELLYTVTSSNQVLRCFDGDSICDLMGGQTIGSTCNFCQALGGTWITGSPGHCEIAKDCNLPWGGTIASGASVTAYNPSACGGITRTCSHGTLGGDAAYNSPTRTKCTQYYLGWRRTGYAPYDATATSPPSVITPVRQSWLSCNVAPIPYPDSLGKPGCGSGGSVINQCPWGNTSGVYADGQGNWVCNPIMGDAYSICYVKTTPLDCAH